jgi:hypothetical protein
VKKNLTALNLKRALKKAGNKEKAMLLARFFKTGRGQYAEGDKFLGVTVPVQRAIVKKYQGLTLWNPKGRPKAYSTGPSLPEIKKFLYSPYHECRLTGLLILVGRYKIAKPVEQKKIASFYLLHRSRVNNWDLVDLSSWQILGGYLYEHKQSRQVLYRLAKSKSLWDRRIAIIATAYFISKSDFTDTLKLAEMYFSDRHDLIHKATGWMLREVGKKIAPLLLVF